MSTTNAKSARTDATAGATSGTSTGSTLRPVPNPSVQAPYRSTAPSPPVDLWLAGNEGRAPQDITATAAAAPDLSRYPSIQAVARVAATHYGVEPTEIFVTAGADDGLLRVALGFLGLGREAILPTPTFEMIPRYIALSGGSVQDVAWEPGAPYPVESVLGAINERTSVIYVVSPNNPTGSVATEDDLIRIAKAAPSALIVLDAAYGEFADSDLTDTAKALPNVIVLRTLSKAFGCAGLRVGFVLGAPPILRSLAAAGNPYPCAAPALVGAELVLRADPANFISRVQEERDNLQALLVELGLPAPKSQGNFVYAATPHADSIRALVSGSGIAIRSFASALRITCPGDPGEYARLEMALRAALRPGAILFDMDGVLADVSRSYRAAILQTAGSFGADVADRDVDAAKAQGGANDDWALTWRLTNGAGIKASLEEVTARFEALYQGALGVPGLRETESLLFPRESLAALAARRPLGIVTGRPRRDANEFLERFGIAEFFGVVVAREDAALKPSGEPTAKAMRALGVDTAWLLGDTPDDILSARAAGATPIGVVPPSRNPAKNIAVAESLTTAGAGVVLGRISELPTLLQVSTAR